MDKRGRSIFVLGIFFVLIVSIIIPFVFSDSGNTKIYDAESKIVTIKDSNAETIAEVKLNTPLNNKVGLGYQKVAEMNSISFTDYEKLFGIVKTYNLKGDMNELNRIINFKYLSYEDVLVDDYEDVCGLLENGTNKCSLEIVGSHTEQREVWLDFDKEKISKKDEIVTIGLFTNVQKDDYVEWIPTIAGLEIQEWAIWTASLNTDLISYWKLDGDGEVVEDSLGIHDGTAINSTGTTGKIDGGRYFPVDGNLKGQGSTLNLTYSTDWDFGPNEFSISFWVKPNGSVFADADMVGIGRYDSEATFRINRQTNGSLVMYSAHPSYWDVYYTDLDIANNSWSHVVVIKEGTQFTLFINDVMAAGNNTGVDTLKPISPGWTMRAGTYWNGGHFEGIIDEIGVWNRSLSREEVTQLYNGGDGITYDSLFNYTITFNLTDSYTEEQIDTTGPQYSFDISCDNGLSEIDVENPYIPSEQFASGTWECTFYDINAVKEGDKVKYFDKTQNITVTQNETIEISVSQAKYLTSEEHDWLEAIYDCIIDGTGCAS